VKIVRADTGIGIQPSLGNIFDMFSQVDATRVPRGSGLARAVKGPSKCTTGRYRRHVARARAHIHRQTTALETQERPIAAPPDGARLGRPKRRIW